MATETVCDICKNRKDVWQTDPVVDEARDPIQVEVKGKSVSVRFYITTDAGNDMCNRCRATALRQAAQQLHSTSTRGRKKGKVSDGKGKGKNSTA